MAPTTWPPNRPELRKAGSDITEIELRVHSMAGWICTVCAERTWSLFNIKRAVELRTAIPIQEQQLLYGCTPLPDALPLLYLYNLDTDCRGNLISLTLIRRRTNGNPERSARYCESCKMWVNSPSQWERHILGRRHRRNVLQPHELLTEAAPRFPEWDGPEWYGTG